MPVLDVKREVWVMKVRNVEFISIHNTSNNMYLYES